MKQMLEQIWYLQSRIGMTFKLNIYELKLVYVQDLFIGNLVFIGLFQANFEPKIEWTPNVFWGGSEEVMCSLPHDKSHSEDGTSKPFMSEWEGDVVFEFVELNI